jgi:hypothetical protein
MSSATKRATAAIDDDVGVDADDDLGVVRFAHRVVDALALAHVVRIAQDAHAVGEDARRAAGPVEAVVGGAIVDDGDAELVGRIVERDQAQDGVVDRVALVVERNDDGHGRLVVGARDVEAAAFDDAQVEPEDVAVGEDHQHEEKDWDRVHCAARLLSKRCARRQVRENQAAARKFPAVARGLTSSEVSAP